MKDYILSLFSLKKITHKGLSLFVIWDKKSKFSKQTYIRWNVKLLNSQIGKYSRVKQNCIISNATIGNFCGIGQNSQIGTGRHPINYLSTNLIFYQKNILKNDWVRDIKFEEILPITIGNDVWIGINCLIMDGVKIGDGAIIGSNSVVTKDVPPYAIAAGVPAKIIKYRFSENIIKKLLEIKWWLKSDAELSNVIDLFTIPDINIEILNKYFNNN